MKHHKLVRDKIPAHIRSKGGEPVFHIANDQEYWQKLKEKLIEEFGEFKENESIEEFADMIEVLEAIAEYKRFTRKAIEKARREKGETKGRFKERIILDET